MYLSKLYEMPCAGSKRCIQGKTEKILALQVKIGEIAKGTKCFNNLDTNRNTDRKTLLAHYSECFCLILCIGADNRFRPDDVELKPSASSLTTQFETLYVDINDFVVCSTLDNYTTLLEDFLSLSVTFGFSEEEIIEAYKCF
ncbi:MAG: dUTP diphosphatase [Clostridiaceae bacterium]